MKKVIFSLFLLTLTGFGQINKIQFKEIGTIGNSDEFYLQDPKQIKVDEQNRIYILDKDATQITILNDDGSLFKVVGRKGKGPGEFLEIMCFLIDKNNIVIFDRANARFTNFNLVSNKFKVYPMLEKYDISMLDKLNDETYVGYKSACEKTGNNLFLTFSKDIKIQSTFGEPLKMLVNSSSNFERDFSNSSLSFEICSINTNTIIVSPILYDGKLIILHYDSMNCHYNYIDGFQPSNEHIRNIPFQCQNYNH